MRLVLFQPDNQENLRRGPRSGSNFGEKPPRRVFLRRTTDSVVTPGQALNANPRSRQMILAALVSAAVFVVIAGQHAIESRKSR
jgi:hypothetical protein